MFPLNLEKSITKGLSGIKFALKNIDNVEEAKKILSSINPMIFHRIEQSNNLKKIFLDTDNINQAISYTNSKFNNEIKQLKKAEAKRKRAIEKREIIQFFENNAKQIIRVFQLKSLLKDTKNKLIENIEIAPLNLSRDLLPQIDDIEDFVEFLTNNHINWYVEKIKICDIKSTQSEFNREKIENLKKNLPEIEPFILSNDGYLLDGHHRFIAMKEINPNQKVPIIHIKKGIMELLTTIQKDYGKSYSKSINS